MHTKQPQSGEHVGRGGGAADAVDCSHAGQGDWIIEGEMGQCVALLSDTWLLNLPSAKSFNRVPSCSASTQVHFYLVCVCGTV